MLSLICALCTNRAIGKNNQLLYPISADLKRFKALTTGHTVVMGRRTFDSLPKGALPNRRNIVLTRNPNFSAPNVDLFASLPDALAACANEEVFVIGGASLYAEALPLADKLFLTHIHATPTDADVFFPDWESDDWECVAHERHATADGLVYDFSDYKRLSP